MVGLRNSLMTLLIATALAAGWGDDGGGNAGRGGTGGTGSVGGSGGASGTGGASGEPGVSCGQAGQCSAGQVCCLGGTPQAPTARCTTTPCAGDESRLACDGP